MTMLEDLEEAMAEAARQTLAAPFDSVENHDGLAVFKRNGNVVGWMNWSDYETLIAEVGQ